MAYATTFASMALVPGRPGTRLVQVRAVSEGAPFYGMIETEPAGQWAQLQRGRHALVDPSLLIALNAHVGDTLFLGFARFDITGTLEERAGGRRDRRGDGAARVHPERRSWRRRGCSASGAAPSTRRW